jgi:hypothetical protein
LGGAFLLLTYIFVIASCRTPPVTKDSAALSENAHIRAAAGLFPESETENKRWNWQEIAPEVQYFAFSSDIYKLRWHLLKFALNTPQLTLHAYPTANGDTADNIEETGIFDGKKTEQFAAESGAQIVLNASPFAAPNGLLNKKRKTVGMYIYEGKILSPPIEKYAALVFLQDNTPLILASQSETLPDDARFAFGGFFQILKDREIIPFRATSYDSRTAIGISEDKNTLFILAVEGENRLVSKGMSFEECALLLRTAGAADAIQMDGGSSTSLSLLGKRALGYPEIKPAGNLLGFSFRY